MELKDFFRENRRAALGFSGGVDSAYLLAEGLRLGADIRPYFTKSVFQPEFELKDAKRLCAELGTELTVIELNVLSIPEIASNQPERCYFCKRQIFGEIKKRAVSDGYDVITDGTNASDDYGDRPGMRAIRELGVLSPLRECGLTKDDVRRLSREMGLFTWDKPSYSCLATRIAGGESIDTDKLRRIEAGEMLLFSMGFSDFRLRSNKGSALLQLKAEQADKGRERFEEIKEGLKPYFSDIRIDEVCR